MHTEFIWFIGVVEDRLDPKKLGRCRVRILGQHTEEKKKIPTDELPWAQPMHPITSAAMNGIGDTPVGPVEGTWVIGFHKDGLDCQEPVIMGTLGGIPNAYPDPESKTYGFLDPRVDLTARPRKVASASYPTDGTGAELKNETPKPETGEKYPRTKHPNGCVVGEVDTNRLARNENINESIVQRKKDSRDLQVPIADGTSWDEPETPYDPSYPYNKVTESESGHVMEVDDTVGGERLHTWHRSGTFEEIYPDGVKVERVVGNNYKISMEEKYEHVQNRYNLTIDGPFNIIVQNDANIVIKGDGKIEVGGDLDVEVGGDYNLSANGAVNIKGSSVALGAKGSISLKGTSISTNPAVSQSLEAIKAGGISIVIPKLPIPSGSSVSPANNTSARSYPRTDGPYITTKESL